MISFNKLEQEIFTIVRQARLECENKGRPASIADNVIAHRVADLIYAMSLKPTPNWLRRKWDALFSWSKPF